MAGIDLVRAVLLLLGTCGATIAVPADTPSTPNGPGATNSSAASPATAAATAPVCEPTKCMILDVGVGYNRGPSTNLKHCRRDDNCCAPAERAACAPGYRYSRGGPCDGDGRCGDHAVCCTRCLPGEACAEKSEDFGRAVRCGGRGARFHWLPVTLVVALGASTTPPSIKTGFPGESARARGRACRRCRRRGLGARRGGGPRGQGRSAVLAGLLAGTRRFL